MYYNIKQATSKYYIYLVSIIMLSNGLLFNYIFLGTPLRMWRQIIWIVGFYSLFEFLIFNFGFIKKQKFFIHLQLSFIILLVVSVITFFRNEYNVLRIILGWMYYIFGYSFIILPFIIIKLKKEIVFFKFLTWLGIIISIGLIIDGLNNNIFSFVRANYIDTDIEVEINRATFLSEACTILGISQLLFMSCNLLTFYLSESKFWKVFYFFTTFIFLVGGWFTASRQVFFILLTSCLLALSYWLITEHKRIFFVLLIIVPLIIVTYSFLEFNRNDFESNSYAERYTKDTDGGNAVRISAWGQGIDQLSMANFPYWFIGQGFTYTMGQQALPNEKVGYHMESSVWAMFSECGIFSWYVFFWPWLYSVKLWFKMKKSFIKVLFFCILVSYIFTAFVSPNASHFLATMSLFIVLGFLINFRYADNTLIDKLKL